jgi:Undecaprenyl-phosphate glucose phosphotransferase
MLKRHHEFFKGLMLLSDLVFVSLSWWLAYFLRFHTAFLFSESEPYVLRDYRIAWLLILIVWFVIFQLLDVYRPRRISTRARELADLIKGCSLALLVFLGVLFLMRGLTLSRAVVLCFWLSSLFFLNLSHVAFREGLRFLRKRGYNLRHVIIVGAPKQSRDLLHKLDWYRHLGFHIRGIYFTEEWRFEAPPEGVPVLETRDELLKLIRDGSVDQLFVALPLEQASRVRDIQQWLGDEPITLHFVPDFGKLATLRGSMEEFDGLSIITLQSSPLYGWNSLLKRSMDISLGFLAFWVFSPVMLVIAVITRLTSAGPIFYRQERMGLDGRRFEMLKFRTMRQDAEQLSGPVWASDEDPRVTPFGRWLRRTSLDELPQLINVLKGEMSLVGPRPERPPLIEQFRSSIPKYMLRHKVKAGMTGWAQVNGWRGNTSLEKRIEHDLDYIEHWSLWRDVKILARTVVVGFRNSRASNL